MRTGPVLAVLLAAILPAAAAAAPPSTTATPVEAELIAARDAAMRGQPRALEAWRARNPGHLLEPYAHYWLISSALPRADAGEVRAFLLKNERTPLAETLRREWLKVVGAAGDWSSFRAEYQGLATADAEVTCLALQDRISQGDPEATGEARALFLSSRESPSACDPAFAALAADGRLEESEIWDRLRRLLAANHLREARRVNALLPKRVAIEDRSIDRAAAETLKLLSRDRTKNLGQATRELALFALVRLARAGRADEAAERLVELQARLGPEAVQFTWSQIGLQAALNHDPHALTYYERAGTIPLTESQAAWKARAALRLGDWKAVLAAIQAMPPEQAREPAWRYWRARAWREMGEKVVAEGLLRSLSGDSSFYGLLASEEMGSTPSAQWDTAPPAQAELERIRALPGIQRALALYRLDYDNEALREWAWALSGMDDRSLLAAAEVARLADVPDRAIATANRTVQIHDFGQRYPIPHRELLAPAARQWGLDEAIVYSIIRQESRFMPDARSRAGAAGLMQLMPATARWVARQIPVQAYRREMLAQPETNILMGTYYFRRVLDDLGHPVLAAAAYNAGPGRARRWRDERALEAAIYVESIPFNETRQYVKNVFANAWFYRYRLEGKPASLKQMIGTVPGRAADAAGPVASSIP